MNQEIEPHQTSSLMMLISHEKSCLSRVNYSGSGVSLQHPKHPITVTHISMTHFYIPKKDMGASHFYGFD